ncbi:splicing factor U2AF 26 kDa subunit isoform X1 [Dermochelys coriacea]|uniref:splicing factor U2AF 26 kDa subunit isoform X1 n=1 Tax=Dermochelys coriacea TaxID=27794 RepID=UPI0018E72106|nr:splicing factor U2AF 26 kDa subunit isoform X1 [Dermochelys coriacea]
MAEYLASIFGTEKDKVNCSFYFKIGACRHGDRCSRLHNRPTFSQTIVLLNLYRNPQNTAQSADSSHCHVSDVEVQEHYDNFFEEVFTELEEKYGEIEEMNVCDNLGDHLVGNVYVKFRREEDAERAVGELNNRWFNGQAVRAELSPVTDFRESCCRQYEMGECTRGGFCNFMHLRPISRELRRQLYGQSRCRRYGRASRQTWRFLWLSRTPPISGPGYFPSCRAAQPRNQRLRFDLFSDVRKPGQLLFLLSASMLCTAESCCAAKGLLGDCARLRVHIINESCCMVAAVLPFAHQRAPW